MTTEQRMYSPELYELDLSQLLNKIGIDSPTFIGQAKHSQNGLFFENVYSNSDSKSGVLLSDPIYGYNLKVDIIQQNGSIDIKEGKYYKFRIEFAENKDIRIERNQPFLFRAIDIEEAENPYYNDVKIAFQRNTTNPSSNQRDAKLLEEIGKNMYSSKERMFYELIQNADDSAASNGVKIFAKTDQDYLIIKYNGYSFNKDDFEAITSAANGTKKTNENKTGYKGIGFKSVFTDSTQVYIKTGGYQFRFDKNDKVFEDFDSFYLQNNPTLTNEESKNVFLTLYKYYKKQFNGVHSIPWQLEPIWTDEYPHELGEDFANANVAIALRLGINKIEGTNGYQAAIDEIINNPKFMLFLRNTTHIDFNGKIISKQIQNNIISLENSFNEDTHNERFYLEEYCIDINNDVFEQSDIDIRLVIKEKDEQTGKIKEAVFVNNNNEEYENIPAKIAINSTTSISFALPVDENGALKLEPNNNDISMFAYLPTLVKDFHFPFYVNANFILDPPRQRILGDNPWNFFLMQEIAKLLVKCCAQWSKQGDYNALNILIPHLFDEESSDIRFLSKYFNNAYKAALTETAFIFNYDNGLSRQDEIILDKTGLSNIIGADVFCSILKTTKTLPSSKIDASILTKDIFEEIERIKLESVVNKLHENIDVLNKWYLNADSIQKENLHQWIIKNIEQCKVFIGNLPIFVFGNEPKCYNEIKDNSTYIITTEHIKPIKDILEKNSFICSSNSLEDTSLNQYIETTKESVLFEQIISRLNVDSLTNLEKLTLFQTLGNFEDVGDAKLSKIALFCNVKDEATPLSQMLPYRIDAPTWLHPYMICQEDNFDELSKYLVSPYEEFSAIVWEHINDIPLSLSELYTNYKWTDQKYTQELIKKCTTNDDFANLLPIIQDATKPVKQQYLDAIKRLYLSSDKFYSKDSFEYHVLQLALEVFDNPSDFSSKIYYNDTCITEYSIKDEVICNYNDENGIDKKVIMSLAKLLLDYQNKSEGLNKLKDLFEVKSGLDRFFIAKAKTISAIYSELNAKLSIPDRMFSLWNVEGNAQQYLFSVYVRRNKGWNLSYVPKIVLENQTDAFINELLNFLFSNQISISVNSKFTHHLYSYFENKYFNNDYITDNERLLPAIERWADTPEKIQYLTNYGVKTANDKALRFRQLFIEDKQIDFIDELSNIEIASALRYLSIAENLQRPYIGNHQPQVLLALKDKKTPRLADNYNVEELSNRAVEFDNEEYQNWIVDHYLKIFIYPKTLPKELEYDGIVLLNYNDTDYYYDKGNKKLYLNQLADKNTLLFEIAKSHTTDFDIDDYQILCLDGKVLIAQEEKEALETENKRLNDEVQRLKEILSKYEIIYDNPFAPEQEKSENTAYSESNNTPTMSKGEDNVLSKNEQIDAQLEAQKFLMQKYPNWKFPDGYGYESDNYSTVTIHNEKDEAIKVVLKSYKSKGQGLKINIPEWDFIIEEDAQIWIYTGYDIVEIDVKEMLKNQNKLSISFNTNNLDVEDKIQQFADAMRYFNELHLDFDCFNLSENAIPIDQLYNKHAGEQQSYTDDEAL